MKQDKFGQIILNQEDLCNLLLSDGNLDSKKYLVDENINFDNQLELENIPNLIQYIEQNISVEQFDKNTQSHWHMPIEYHDLDIAKYVLDKCKTTIETQRVGKELLMYLERDLFPMLQYLKYLVDTMRLNNVVWGVGRGSSVSSYVLFLIGVHKIDSIYYSLDIEEFLR